MLVYAAQIELDHAQWPELALLYAELLSLGLFMLSCSVLAHPHSMTQFRLFHEQ